MSLRFDVGSVLLGALPLLGCSSPEPAEPVSRCNAVDAPPAHAPAIEVLHPGTLEPLEAGAALYPVSGSQGGRHVDLVVRLFAGGRQLVDVRGEFVSPADGAVLGEGLETIRTCGERWTDVHDLRVFLYAYGDQPMMLRVRAPFAAAESVVLELPVVLTEP
ncbi:MAG: hypothetical protein KF718_01995 [Polyangiaceae bacterium]|nr:hypothetical protein [Polyangiaceae bacterium]